MEIVKTHNGEGRGVVFSGLIITAAHCVEWNNQIGTHDDFARQAIQTESGKELITDLVYFDPVSDVAVLSAPDEPRHHEAFHLWIESVESAKLFSGDLGQREIRIYNRSEWVAGKADDRFGWGNGFQAFAPKQIVSGASGGPIVTTENELVGVVSTFSETGGPCDGQQPYLPSVLPSWLPV